MRASPATPDQASSTAGARRGLASLRPYLSLLRGQELFLTVAGLLMLVSTAVSLAIPLVAGRLVDAFGGQGSTGAPAGLDRRLLLWMGLLLLAQLAGSFLFSVASARLALTTVTRLRRRLFAHLLELPALFFSGQKAGDLSTRVTSDVGAIQYVLTGGLISLARAVLTLAGALALMSRLNLRLTLVVVLLIPATVVLVRLFGTRLRGLSRRMYDGLGRISSQVQESIGGIATLKVHNAQGHEKRRFEAMIADYQRDGERRAWLSAALEAGIQMALWICLIGVVVYGFVLAARGQASGGQLVAFLLLAFRVAVPLASLSSLYAEGQGAAAAAARLDDIFALAPERDPAAAVPPVRHEPAAIRLEGIHFRYPPAPGSDAAREVLRGIDLEIGAGQWVGLVGPSGSGKTTLAGLLMGLYPPTQGRLLLDGRPYADFDPADLRAAMAFVAQEPVLHDISLAENIRFGLAGADDATVRRAAERAGVTGFADQLPAGLETVTGERGVRLSGGQRQRIALARAFLRDPGILVLDEPTSALDAASEEAVRLAMRELMRGRTTIVIAHRLSLVRDLDVIVVLADGQIVEIGNHSQLMATPGLYASLYTSQQGLP
ncbi:MAG: ABC transporter ATP-binding protein [bacterium]|jgi:ABC-type multidrug transport system fused ATPase/permease subunit|nr:ABC transporter ATP-binding protein [bacterium]